MKSSLKFDTVSELRMTAAELVARARDRMVQILEKKGYRVGDSSVVPRVEYGKKGLQTAYFANLALEECHRFDLAWQDERFRDAAKHAFLVRKHQAMVEAGNRNEERMAKSRSAKPSKKAIADEALKDRVRLEFTKRKGDPLASAKAIHRFVDSGMSLRTFEAWFTRNRCVKMRSEIRSEAQMSRLLTRL